MDWMDVSMINSELALMVKNMDRETGRVFWRSWSENVHSCPLTHFNARRVDDTGDRVCMYFSTWTGKLKHSPLTIEKRIPSWNGSPPKASFAGSIETGLKIVTHPFTRTATTNHMDKIEQFYSVQKKGYDAFREGLLHARPLLIEMLPLKVGGKMTWVDIGGGTCRNLEFLAVDVLRQYFAKIVIVDISPSLLSMAKERIAKAGLDDIVELVQADINVQSSAAKLPKAGTCDIVTLSYSLSMIPDRKLALSNARKLIKPKGEGFVGIADFFMDSGDPHAHLKSPIRTRVTWVRDQLHRLWFKQDGVMLLPTDLLEVNPKESEVVWDERQRGGVPFLPFLRPYHGVRIIKSV